MINSLIDKYTKKYVKRLKNYYKKALAPRRFHYKKHLISLFSFCKGFSYKKLSYKHLEIEKYFKINISIVDKYVLKDFLKTFIAVLSILVLVILARLFIKLLEYVVEGRFDFDMIFNILMLSTAKSTILLLPFALMVSTILSISRIYRDSEIYPLVASGYYTNFIKKMFSIIVVPSFLSIFILNLFISPLIVEEIQLAKIKASSEAKVGLMDPGKFIQLRDKDWIIFVESVENKVAKKIFIKSNENEKVTIETAKSGIEKLEEDMRQLVLYDGQRYTGDVGRGDFQVLKYDSHLIKLMTTNIDLYINHKMMSISDLFYDGTQHADAEIQWRLFAPISIIILILFAFELGKMKPRQSKYSNLIYAILIYFVYSNFVILSVNGIKNETILFSYIGTWWVHIFAGISFYLVFKKREYIESYIYLVKSGVKKLWQ